MLLHLIVGINSCWDPCRKCWRSRDSPAKMWIPRGQVASCPLELDWRPQDEQWCALVVAHYLVYYFFCAGDATIPVFISGCLTSAGGRKLHARAPPQDLDSIPFVLFLCSLFATLPMSPMLMGVDVTVTGTGDAQYALSGSREAAGSTATTSSSSRDMTVTQGSSLEGNKATEGQEEEYLSLTEQQQLSEARNLDDPHSGLSMAQQVSDLSDPIGLMALLANLYKSLNRGRAAPAICDTNLSRV